MSDDHSSPDKPVKTRRLQARIDGPIENTESRWNEMIDQALPEDYEYDDGSEEVRFK
jgi:hypothetical protein